MRKIADRLGRQRINRIVSSSQMRAHGSAGAKAGLAVETVEGLAEVDRYTHRYR
jgi:hypothetical protein